MADYQKIKKAIRSQANRQRALISARFFKTKPGQYGAGDIFIGLTVPTSRTIAHQFLNLNIPSIKKLLRSPIHEERLIALLILVARFNNGNEKERLLIFNFYLTSTRFINNWDLVDLSADKIVGEYLFNQSTKLLTKLAYSTNLWERRIAIVATFAFIKKGDYKPTLRLAKILLTDQHDLIHKAVGWMLREVGKRASLPALRSFLAMYSHNMPRTMLRYAIERLPKKERKNILLKKSLSNI